MSVSGKHFFASSSTWVSAAMLTWLLAGTAFCQTVPTSAGRKLAPGALHVIPPSAAYGETFQGPVDLPFVSQLPELAWTPNYLPENETLLEMGKQVVFRGRVHSLEFAFKPVRMIDVDIETPAGSQRKTVWYMLYRVRYLGGELQPKAEQDQFNNQVFGLPEAVSSEWVRFMPTFTLDAKVVNERYLDKVIPSALPAIAARERVANPRDRNALAEIFDSIQMQRQKIQLSTQTEDNSVWGIATWTDVDPRTDLFAVEVRGLTNAQRIELDGEELKTQQKTLVLHFSRPGDTVDELDDRIRFGIPALSEQARQEHILRQFGVQERLDYMWVYR